MSEDFLDKEARMWPTHGRMSREDYLFPPKERFKRRLRRLLSRRWSFGGWRWRTIAADWRLAATDPLRYQDCVRRRNEYLDLFCQPTPPARIENAILFGDVLISDLPLIGHFEPEKSPGGAKQASPEAPAPVQQENK